MGWWWGGGEGREKVPYCTSCVCGNRVSAFQEADALQRKSAVLHQLCHFSLKRLEEKWHNWYSTALFLYREEVVAHVRKL